MHSNLNQQPDKVMTPDQFTQVVAAILEGKYSWACLLILRFAGYNPLHYIPYRTYNRLMKDHAQRNRIGMGGDSERYAQQSSIRDLGYLEPLAEQQAQVRGGAQVVRLDSFHSVFERLRV